MPWVEDLGRFVLGAVHNPPFLRSKTGVYLPVIMPFITSNG